MRRSSAVFRRVLALAALSSALSAQARCVSTAQELLAAIPLLQPGEHLVLASTTFVVPQLLLSGVRGTPDRWIVIRSADRNQRARIEGFSATDPAVAIANCAFLRFEDLEITIQGGGANRHGVHFRPGSSSSYVEFDACWIHDVTGHGIGSEALSLDRLAVLACHIHDCGRSGVDLGSIGSQPAQVSTGALVRDCLIRRTGSTGAYTFGLHFKPPSSGCTIENNVLVDCGGVSGASIATYWAGATGSGGRPPADWHRVRRNVIWDVDPAPYEGIYVTNSAVVTDNIVFGTRYGIGVSDYSTGNVVDNVKLAHNTVYACPGACFRFSGAAALASNCEVTNNVAAVAGAGAYAYDVLSGLGASTFANNGASGPTRNVPRGLVPLGAPASLFANATTAVPGIDVYPAPGSALIGAGLATAYSGEDCNGVARPGAGAVDLGAYRFTLPNNPGWRIATGSKPSLLPLQPLVADASAIAGARVDWTLQSRQPTGSWYLLLASVTGPTTGPLAVVVDPLTQLAVDPSLSQVFVGYVGQIPPGGRVAARLDLPPLVLAPPCPLTLYHAAVVFGPTLEVSNRVRLLLRP